MWTQPRPQGQAVSVEGIWTLFVISLLHNLLSVELAPRDLSRPFYLPAASISVFRVRVFRTRIKKENSLARVRPPAVITPRPPSGSPSALTCPAFLLQTSCTEISLPLCWGSAISHNEVITKHKLGLLLKAKWSGSFQILVSKQVAQESHRGSSLNTTSQIPTAGEIDSGGEWWGQRVWIF